MLKSIIHVINHVNLQLYKVYISGFLEKQTLDKKYLYKTQKHRPELFLRKGVLKICSKFKGEHPC